MKILKCVVILWISTSTAFGQGNPLWKIYYDSTQSYWARDWARTVSLLEKAERSAVNDLGLYDQNYLTILNDLGTAYWKAGQHEKAESTLGRSLALKSEVYPATDKEVILSMSNLAGFLSERGQWKESKALYSRIVAIDPSLIPTDLYVEAARNLLALFDRNQQTDSAEYLLQRLEDNHVVQRNSLFAFQHAFYKARMHRKLQQYALAGEELEGLVKALDGQAEAGFPELYIQSLQEEGLLFLETGAYSRAEKKLLEAYESVTADMDREYLLTELSNNLAQVYDKLHIYDKALLYYRESLDRCQASYDENALPCVVLQNNIAGVHLRQNNIAQAISDYEKVLSVFGKLLAPSDDLYITALNNLATAYRKNNQLDKALESLSRARSLLKTKGLEKDDLFATVLNNIAVVNTAMGNIQEAADNYKRALDIKTAIYGDESLILIDLVSNLTVAYWALDRPKDAIPLFKKAMSLATRQVTYVFPNLNESEQVQFYEKLKEDFERFNTIAIQWADRDAALLAQVFQNRMVIKSLRFFTYQRRKNFLMERNDPALNRLVSRLKECRDRVGYLYQLPLGQLTDVSEISSLEKEIDAIEKRLSLYASDTASPDGVPAGGLTWDALMSELQPNEAIVEMVRFRKYDWLSMNQKHHFGFTDSVYYAALVLTKTTRARPMLVLFPDGQNLETRYYNYYKNAIRYGVEDNLSYHHFWAPLEKALAGKTRIFFSSDGVYHKLNVNTLRDLDSDRFLCEKVDVVYLLNPVQVLDKAGPLNKDQNAVLMGDPAFDVDVESPRERSVGFSHFSRLTGTQQELRTIHELLRKRGWRTELYLSAAATETNLKAVKSPAILHIASHGFFSDEVVTLNTEAKKDFLFHSGLVLTGANKSLANQSTDFGNDGIVTAYEVMNLDLSATRLVVLSACETGLGKIESGEGVFGLQRSFMQAGADNVLISLWKVDDDATRDLMIKFYEYLTGGHSLHDALRRAQADQARLHSDPALWGAFVLVGNK